MAGELYKQYTEDELVDILVDPKRHAEIADELLDQFTHFCLSIFGHTNDSNLIPSVAALYERFRRVVPRETRDAVYEAIAAQVEAREISANALLPFVHDEDARALASRAALDLAMYAPALERDELSGVRHVLGLIKGGRAQNNGAILGGLLLTGDRRVMELLAPHRGEFLAPEILDECSKTQSGLVYRAVVEFYLDWLEELMEGGVESAFGAVASALVLMLRHETQGTVFEVRRGFGMREGEPPAELLEQQTFSEYFEQVRPRMEAIALRETEPKVMPEVIAAWEKHCAQTQRH